MSQSAIRRACLLAVLIILPAVGGSHGPSMRTETIATLPVPPEAFPILGWAGVPEQQTSLKRYREMADAGFTINFASASNADGVLKQLDIAKTTGLKMLVSCGDLLNEKAAVTVNRLKGHPALAGYYVRDEPSASDFATVAAQVKRIQAADKRHPCYVNLFPNYATPGRTSQLGTDTYQQYVDRFVQEVPVPIFSFDHYPVTAGPDGHASLRPEWYENLEIIAAAARKTRKPMWAFALSCPHAVYPTPTLAHLRVQVYSDLAYGAQVIQYFTYWAPEPKEFNFHDAPITVDGKRTATYDLVKQMNREIQALRGVFLGAKVLSVGHTGKTLPRGTRAYRPESPVKVLKTGGIGAVISTLSCEARRFLVIVNRNINGPMPLTVELDGSAQVQRVAKGGTLRPVEYRRFEARIEPGDLRVLTWPGKPKK
jgi:hypothetical protein